MVATGNEPALQANRFDILALQKGEFLGAVSHWHQTNGVTLSVTSYEPQDQQANQLHYHEHPNLYFILAGGSIEKRKAAQTTHQAGSLLFYPAGEPHQNIRQGLSAKSINLEVEFSFLQRYELTESMVEQLAGHSSESKFRILSMYRELVSADSLASVSLDFLLLALLGYCAELKTYDRWPTWVKTVHALIHDRWNETLTLQELSLAAGVNPITISKHFGHYFASTYGEYVRKLKTEKALTLIKNTQLPLTEIAHVCGFADQSHFIRSFKKYIGFLPGQFRKL